MIQPSLPPAEPVTFEAIYRRHERDVVRYLAFLLRDLDDAEDVASDAFERAFRAWRDGRGPAGVALPWLLTIAAAGVQQTPTAASPLLAALARLRAMVLRAALEC